MGEKLTASDVEKIQEEIRMRKLELRPKILADLTAAAAQGDRSDNFEYTAAKRKNSRNNSRINYLEKMLKYATIISDQSAPDEVGLNNTVTIRYDEDGEEETVRIVTSIRSHSTEGLISEESPVGRALLGHKAGDRVKVTLDSGDSYFVTIQKLVKTGESETDHIKEY